MKHLIVLMLIIAVIFEVFQVYSYVTERVVDSAECSDVKELKK